MNAHTDDLATSGLVGRFRRATFESFDARTDAQQHALGMCIAFAAEAMLDKSCAGLWLVGPVGTGKTHLASAIVHYVITTLGVPAAIHAARDIARMVGDESLNYQGDPRGGEALNRLGNINLLVIDDVGVGCDTDRERADLHEVIDMRYRLELATVIITNLASGKELKAALGAPAYDRLQERAEVVTMNWSSHRGPR